MPDDPYLKHLFPDGAENSRSAAALRSRTSDLFPYGSYQPNPLTDPATHGSSLAKWYRAGWDDLRSKIPLRRDLPDGVVLDKTWTNNKVNDLVDNLSRMEASSSTAQDRSGYANLALQKLEELQGEVPLEGLASIEVCSEAATMFRNTCFTTAKCAVASVLHDEIRGASVRDTYLRLELAETASTHYGIGGDPPNRLEIPKGSPAGVYLGEAADRLDVRVPGDPSRELGGVLVIELLDFGRLENRMNGWKAQPPKTPSEIVSMAADQRSFGDSIDRVANLTQAFARQTRELARAVSPDEDQLGQNAELAMVCAEAMRNMTGAIRAHAGAGVTEELTAEQIGERRAAGKKAAKEIIERSKEKERDPRERPLGD